MMIMMITMTMIITMKSRCVACGVEVYDDDDDDNYDDDDDDDDDDGDDEDQVRCLRGGGWRGFPHSWRSCMLQQGPTLPTFLLL